MLRYTLSLQLALVFAIAMILMQVLVLLLDRWFSNELEFNRRLAETRTLSANIINVLPELPQEAWFRTIRSFSLRGQQFFLLDEPVPGPDAIPLPALEEQTREWIERRGLPVTDVFVRQHMFPFTGGFIKSIPGVVQDKMPRLFSAGDPATHRMGDLISEAPLWVPLPPPLGHPPIPGRLERADSIDYYPVVTIAMKLESTGQWVTAYSFLRPPPNNSFITQLYFSIAGTVAIAMFALLIGRRVMAPFRALSQSAEQLGRGERGDTVSVTGPSDMRAVIEAFNHMNGRVSQSIDYQIGLLRSLGHDLKGPLADAYRLLEDVKPESARELIEDRLGRVRGIVESIMSFSRAIMRDGPLQRTDLQELVETLVDEQQDMGADVTLAASASVPVVCRVKATERALQNLIQNAVKYGTIARVQIAHEGKYAVVQIEDEGPGIPEDSLESVFAPFARLADDSDGSGLGLAITRTIAVDQGGDIQLVNRSEGGLRAVFKIPLSAE